MQKMPRLNRRTFCGATAASVAAGTRVFHSYSQKEAKP